MTKEKQEDNTSQKPAVFWAMKFSDDYREVYNALEKKLSDSFYFLRSDTEGHQREFLKNILDGILRAKYVIAEISENNPNVMFELGLAMAWGKKVIMITQGKPEEAPSDIRSFNIVSYSIKFYEFSTFVEELEKLLIGCENGDIQYSNTVHDFFCSYTEVANNSTFTAEAASNESVANEDLIIDVSNDDLAPECITCETDNKKSLCNEKPGQDQFAFDVKLLQAQVQASAVATAMRNFATSDAVIALRNEQEMRKALAQSLVSEAALRYRERIQLCQDQVASTLHKICFAHKSAMEKWASVLNSPLGNVADLVRIEPSNKNNE